MNAVESAREVGIGAKSAAERPIHTHIEAHLPAAHVGGEIVVATLIRSGTKHHLRACRVVDADIAVVSPAVELTACEIRHIGASLEGHLLVVESGLHREGKHPLCGFGHHLAGEHAAKALTTFHHFHLVVLHRSIYRHTLIFKTHTHHQSEIAIKRLFGVDAKGNVGRERKFVHFANTCRHIERSGATQIIA